MIVRSAGIHYNVPSEDYHSLSLTPSPALSAGMAQKLVEDGPARAWVWREKIRKNEEETTEKRRQMLEFGCAAHVAALEPHLLDEKVVLIEASSYTSKAAKEARDAARENGQYPMLIQSYEKLPDMGAAIRNELPGVRFRTAPEIADGVFDDGHGEVTLITGGGDDIWLKARPDYVRKAADEATIVDYKVTGLRGDRMESEARRRNWPLRAAFYRHVYREVIGGTPRYLYMVQETAWPHFVHSWEVPSVGLKNGELEVEEALKLYKQCMKTGEWPSDVDGIRYLFDEQEIGEGIIE